MAIYAPWIDWNVNFSEIYDINYIFMFKIVFKLWLNFSIFSAISLSNYAKYITASINLIFSLNWMKF